MQEAAAACLQAVVEHFPVEDLKAFVNISNACFGAITEQNDPGQGTFIYY